MTQTRKFFLVACMLILSGCAMFRWRRAEIYPMSYDQTYDVALSALDDMETWSLVQTDHKRGIIVIQYLKYLGPERQLTFIVKRIEPFRTKVELYRRPSTPMTQKFFRAIDRRVKERALTYPS